MPKPILKIDDDDAPALSGGELDFQYHRPRIKFAAWDRWKDLDVYLTGSVCHPKNGNQYDLRRENLTPIGKPWRSMKK